MENTHESALDDILYALVSPIERHLPVRKRLQGERLERYDACIGALFNGRYEEALSIAREERYRGEVIAYLERKSLHLPVNGTTS